MNRNKISFYAINLLSIVRIVGIFFIFFFSGIGLLFYVNLLFITDFLDGFLARKYNLESKIGGFLDLIGDKSLVISLLFMFYFTADLPMVIVLLITIREIISMVLRLTSLKNKNKIISPSFLGKSKTALQFIAIDLMIIDFPYYEIVFWIVIVLAYYSLFTYFKRAGN